MSELKPCPYCGSSNVSFSDRLTDYEIHVECDDCGLPGEMFSFLDEDVSITDCRANAAKSWNAMPVNPRHPEPQPIETAPKDGTWILVAGDDYECWMSARWEPINDKAYASGHALKLMCGWGGNGYGYPCATRWIPMPPLPKTDKEVGAVCPICKYRPRISEFGLCGQCQEDMDKEGGA